MGQLPILALLLATTVVHGLDLSTREKRISSWDPVPALYSDCRADVVFLLDGSGSVKIENWVKTLNFVEDFAARVEYGKDKMHFGVASFGNQGSIDLELNEEKTFEEFREKVKNIRYMDENTNTADGLRKLREMFEGEFDRPDAPNVGIVITDGLATREVESTLLEARRVRDAGIILLGIGIGAQLDISQLRKIVANDQAVYDVADFDVLLSRVEDLVGDACKAVTAPSTTTPAPLDTCYSRDVAFVLDASGSISKDDFEKMKGFTRDFVDRMPIGPDNNLVSLITYSTESFIHAKLGQYTNKFELLNVIDSMKYVGQRTNTSGAIRTVHEVFKNEPLDRQHSHENIAIVITDGKSNTDEHLLISAVNNAKWEGNIKFFTIGVGEKADYYEMAMIANQPTFDFANYEDDFDALLATSNILYDHICKRAVYAPFTMTYDIPAPIENGQLDYSSNVIFVMDASPSVDLDLFNLQTTLIKEITQKLRVLPEVRYGVVQFGNEGITHIGFNSYQTLLGFDYELERLNYKQEDVNLASGLDHIETLLEERITSGVKMNKLKPQVVMLTSGKNIYNMELFKNKLAALKIKYPTLHLLPVALGEYAPELLEILSGNLNVELFSKLDLGTHINDMSHYLAYLVSANAADPMWHCDFEKINQELEVVPSTCDLTQLSTDQMDWLIGSGETDSHHTGPLKAANGTHYAYIEATNRYAGDKAMLVGREFGFEGPVCFTFKYNMHGWHAGKLEAVHFIPGWPEWTVWRKFGPQGQEWHEGMVQIYAHPTSKVGIRATRAQGFSGDIAVDDIKLNRGPCPIFKQFVEDERMPKIMPIMTYL